MSRDKKEISYQGAPSPKFKEFGLRLDQAIASSPMSSYQLAKVCNITLPTVRDYIEGLSMPAADKLLRISKALDVPMEYLLTGEGPRGDENIEAGDAGSVTLEVLAEVGAGSARAVAPDEPEHITIGKSFLRGHANGKLFALRIAGESMAPELRTGDIVICEKTVGDLTRIQRDKMYCVRLDEQDGSTIKKLMYVPSSKELLLLPLNPACDPEPIKLHGGARSPVRGVVVAVFRYLNSGK